MFRKAPPSTRLLRAAVCVVAGVAAVVGAGYIAYQISDNSLVALLTATAVLVLAWIVFVVELVRQVRALDSSAPDQPSTATSKERS